MSKLKKKLFPYSFTVARRTLFAIGLILQCAIVVGCDGSSPSEPCRGPLQVGGDVTRPEKLFTPQPHYTEEARLARVQGTVIVQAIINCDGEVTNIKVLQGLPLGLTESTVAAMSRWRFDPARQNGRPVMVYYNLTVSFRLQ